MVMDVSTLCKYDLRKVDLFVLSWARVRRVMREKISSELLMCGGGPLCIWLLPLVARCLETMTVSWKDVSSLTSQLECGKSAGPDGVCVLKLSNLLILWFLFYCHCYLLYVYPMDISLLQ